MTNVFALHLTNLLDVILAIDLLVLLANFFMCFLVTYIRMRSYRLIIRVRDDIGKKPLARAFNDLSANGNVSLVALLFRSFCAAKVTDSLILYFAVLGFRAKAIRVLRDRVTISLVGLYR